MVSSFGLNILLGRRLLRLCVFNLVFLFLNILLWNHDSNTNLYEHDRSSSSSSSWQFSSLSNSWSSRDFQLLSDPLKTIGGLFIKEFNTEYDEVEQHAVVEAWKRNTGIISKKIVSPVSSSLFNSSENINKIVQTSNNGTAAGKVRLSLYDLYQVPRIPYPDQVNCAALLQGDTEELERATEAVKTRPKVPVFEEQYLEWTKDCRRFRKERGYVQIPLSREEEDYPLAFSLAIYRDVEQAERLLRAVYQPQNIYCIHVDTKSSLLFHQTITAIARCFDNVWITTHVTKVKWGDISVILPEVHCMRDLVKYFRGKYKYFINLTGQEFPLRTNLELVWIAKIFNGSNDIAGSVARMDMERVKYRWTHRWSKTYQQTIFYNTFETKKPYPLNITFFKGELHAFFSRRMTEYIVESKNGRRYLEWCWDTGHPSEHYWNTLNYNPRLKAPGGYEGPLEVAENYSVHPIVRIKNWVGMYDKFDCNGRVLRGICVYGLRDIPWLATRKELFANKFNLTYDHLGLDCLEERHRNRTMMRSNVPFDRQFYSELPTVIYGRKDGI